ncbi:hypothetical protein ACS0TY_007947 [Phlomoides rotata]
MKKSSQRIVLVPFPFQGHVTPMLQMGAILHARGFSITVAHTEFNTPDPLDYPHFDFQHLPDQLAGSDTSFYNMLKVISHMNANCKAPFQELLVQMLLDEEEHVCIIHDAIMHFADDAAKNLEIPTMVLRTTSAAYIHSSIVTLQLLAEKVLPLPESRLEDQVPRVHPLKFKDLPLPATEQISETIQHFTRSYMDIRSSSAIIWNTMDMLDRTPLQKLHHRLPFFPIGPLHKIAPSLPTSLTHEDTNCLSWLNKQAPNSVIYVSLGSLATIDKNDIVEMAWGLANSGHPFLWVVRVSLVNGPDCVDCLPENFNETTKGRGCIVRWAPQKKVLAHDSVGGFLSHCGWNSTLESMSEGVPMICGPRFSDQLVNARYLVSEWKVGLELESLDRVCIEGAIRKVLVGKDGKGMRERAMKMKQEIEVGIKKGGSSHKALDDLVNFITSFSSFEKCMT